MNIHALIPQLVWTQFLRCFELLYLDITPAEALTDNTFYSILSQDSKILAKLRSFVVRGRHCGGDVALTETTGGHSHITKSFFVNYRPPPPSSALLLDKLYLRKVII